MKRKLGKNWRNYWNVSVQYTTVTSKCAGPENIHTPEGFKFSVGGSRILSDQKIVIKKHMKGVGVLEEIPLMGEV